MTVEAGYDAHFKQGVWVPVRVVIENAGDAIEGEIALSDDHVEGVIERYTQSISLGKGARRQLTLYVPADTTSFEVSFHNGNQTLINATPLTRQMADNDRPLLWLQLSWAAFPCS